MSESTIVAVIVGISLIALTAIGMYIFRYEIGGVCRKSRRCSICHPSLTSESRK